MPEVHAPYTTIYQPVGGWNAVMMVWDEECECYLPAQTGTNNTLGQGDREGAVAEAKSWADAEDVLYLEEGSSGQ